MSGEELETKENDDELAPLVSVIVPAFNVAQWIGAALDSLVAQTYPNIEVIVIDDGSTDSTSQVVAGYGCEQLKVISLYQQNQGLSATRNRGIKIANGEIILFLDADDWFHPETVSLVVNQFQSHDVEMVVFKCTKYFDKDRTWGKGIDEFYWKVIERRYEGAIELDTVPEYMAVFPFAPTKAFKSDFLKRHNVDFLDNVKYEDNAFHTDLLPHNPSVSFLNKALMAWRCQRDGQITSTPHIADCLMVVKHMRARQRELDLAGRTFLAIQSARLILSVASGISDSDQRTRFVADAIGIVRNDDFSDILQSLNMLSSDNRVHQGDSILLGLLNTDPKLIALSLGRGPTKYYGIFLALTSVLWAIPSLKSALRLISKPIETLKFLSGSGGKTNKGICA